MGQMRWAANGSKMSLYIRADYSHPWRLASPGGFHHAQKLLSEGWVYNQEKAGE